MGSLLPVADGNRVWVTVTLAVRVTDGVTDTVRDTEVDRLRVVVAVAVYDIDRVAVDVRVVVAVALAVTDGIRVADAVRAVRRLSNGNPGVFQPISVSWYTDTGTTFPLGYADVPLLHVYASEYSKRPEVSVQGHASCHDPVDREQYTPPSS
jgi:hypothetical protein